MNDGKKVSKEIADRLEEDIRRMGKKIEELRKKTATEERLDREARLEKMKYDCMDWRDDYGKVIQEIAESGGDLLETKITKEAVTRYKFYNDFIIQANFVLASPKVSEEYHKLERVYDNQNFEIREMISRMSDDEARRIINSIKTKSFTPQDDPSSS